MVQLVMDRGRKHYRVIVVDQCNNVYHSWTGERTRANCRSFGEAVYGYIFNIFNVSPDPILVIHDLTFLKMDSC